MTLLEYFGLIGHTLKLYFVIKICSISTDGNKLFSHVPFNWQEINANLRRKNDFSLSKFHEQTKETMICQNIFKSFLKMQLLET